MSDLSPKEVVMALDKHIIGQTGAKKAVAIALRNRWRRQQLDEQLRSEVSPKNILMIGPTGVGKTEIARRLAKLANAPFLKIEATKFTEVGYVGRDVESIVRDLVDMSVKMQREQAIKKVNNQAKDAAEERILDALLTPSAINKENAEERESSRARQVFRKKLREGVLDDKEIELDVRSPAIGVEIMAPPGMEEMTNQLQNMFSSMKSNNTKRSRLKIKDAMKRLADEEAGKMINEDDIKNQAIFEVEQSGIIFIDEIDKVAKRSEHSGTDISREGVQRDLLPLVEGCTVSTKYGMIKTDHILFIASGAFHLTKPSDLIPELQGRLPIRIELSALSADDFERILTEPNASLTKQYQALIATEGVNLEFTSDGIERIAEIAWKVNEKIENIGARRLHTVMEKLLENLSYESSDYSARGEKVLIDQHYVNEQLEELVTDEDLSRYIL